MGISLCPRANKHGGDGADQDFQIEPQRPVVNVFKVKTHPVLEIGNLIAAADLPEAGEAGLDAQAAAVGQIFKTFHLVHRQRARTDQAHFGAEHVVELRQLVEAVFAEEFSDWRDARVVGDLEDRAAHFIHGLQFVLKLLGVGHHGAEFVKREGRAIEAGALLTEEYRAGRSELDRQRNEGNHRNHRQQHQQQQRPDKIHDLFGDALPGHFRRRAEDEQGIAEQFVETGARNLCPKKIGDQPGFNAFQFAGFDGDFDLLEIGVARADDHPID